MFKKSDKSTGKVLAFEVSGKLTDADYKNLTPVLEKAVADQGKINVLMEFEDFKGWEAKAAWDDYETFRKFKDNFGRIAIVGDKSWEKWMTKLGKLFYGQMKYFNKSELQAAWKWVGEES
ncbi:MAG: STAS/SEC14 domain-containing protein [Methanotrichaceae archaeon]|nr:STAS/SEC14 domain-containing protein [Methanotrichaceae archaeon]